MSLRWQRLTLLLLLLLSAIAAVDSAQAKALADNSFPGQCSNRRKDGTETDIDCGGDECSMRCNLKQACLSGTDCKSSTCDPVSKTCVCPAGLKMNDTLLTCYSEQSLCFNGKRDGSEGDVDCGGSCQRKCALNAACLVDKDCATGVCLYPSKRCGCPASQTLSTDKRSCIPKPQIPPSFRDVTPGNGSKNNTNGLTVLLVPGSSPNKESAAAAAGKQQQPINPNDPCWNGVQDGQESDVDCGGYTCWKCDLGKSCRQSSDCATGTCNPQTKKCVCPPGTAPVTNGSSLCLEPAKTMNGNGTNNHCTNGKFDSGLETDIDCGGNCSIGCKFGHACKVNSDCLAGVCNQDQRICMCPRGQTVSPDMSTCLTKEELCYNGAKDSDETDVDCGGPCASKCKFGQFCRGDGDCETTVCSNSSSNSTNGTSNASARTCRCPASAPLSSDGSKCLTTCDSGPNPCKNGGKCVSAAGLNPNFKCSCPMGFNGSICETQVNTCDTRNPCKNGGKCIPNPGWVPGKSGAPDFRCWCLPGYTGTTCEVARSSCNLNLNICRNGGVCVPLPGKTPDFRCDCKPGWVGMTCNQRGNAPVVITAISNNVTNTTSNVSGQGVSVVTINVVSIPSGLNVSNNGSNTSDACSLAGKSCLNGGVCQVQNNTSDNSSSVTSNVTNSYANVTNTSATCQCAEGYTGDTCDMKLNTCDYSNPCVNGECVALDGEPDYMCSCEAGFTGTLCDSSNSSNASNSSSNATTCDDNNQCQNGGACKPVPADVEVSYDTSYNIDYECDCPEGFYGTLCEIRVNPCDTGSNPCGANGMCQQVPAAAAGANTTAAAGVNNTNASTPTAAARGFTCTCNPGYTGELCDKPAVTIITVSPSNSSSAVTVTTGSRTTCDGGNPCRNGGTCVPKPGFTPDYSCSCASGFTGPLCQTRGDTCSTSNPCKNSANCISQPGSSPDYRCSCGPGFAGSLCDKDCFADGLVPDPAALQCIEPGGITSGSSGAVSSSSGGSGVEVPVLPQRDSQPCGAGRGRLCESGEVCKTSSDCDAGNECKSVPALDNVLRCSCPRGSFIFLRSGGLTRCVTQSDMCSNGVRDVYEGDVDCGFYCENLCGLGKSCRGSSGCESGFCDGITNKCGCRPGSVASADGQSCTPE